MRKDWTPAPKANETKQRIPVWLYPSTLEVVDKLVKQDNCKSRSDYLETAAQFYAGYLSGEEATAYLPPALVAAMRGTVQDSENRIARLLFKLAVEINMMMNVLAAGIHIPLALTETLMVLIVGEIYLIISNNRDYILTSIYNQPARVSSREHGSIIQTALFFVRAYLTVEPVPLDDPSQTASSISA